MGIWGIGGMGKDRRVEGEKGGRDVIGHWALGGKVSEVSKLSKAARMHDCMIDTNFLLNLNLNLFPFVSLGVTSWLIFLLFSRQG
jgi:hypothetical protein